MVGYDDAKARSVNMATTVSVTVVPLDLADDHPLKRSGRVPFQVCCCVTGPCKCHKEQVIWINESAIRSRSASGERNRYGDELHILLVENDADIVVESVQRVKASAFSARGRAARDTLLPTFIIRPRPADRRRDDAQRARSGSGPESSLHFSRADPGCNDYEIEDNGTAYCFVESSEHYCIYALC
jgi:hypothetical protein